MEEVHSLSQPFTERESRYYINVLINDRPIQMMLDSRATCWMIGPKTYAKLGKLPLHPPSSLLKAFGGIQVPLKGWFVANFRFGLSQVRIQTTTIARGKFS